MAYGVLYDGTRCIGCRSCSVACKSWNKNPADIDKKTSVEGGIEGKAVVSDKTFTFMRFREIGDGDDLKWAFAKVQCMHCLKPGCETACIVGALHRKKATGAVSYDKQQVHRLPLLHGGLSLWHTHLRVGEADALDTQVHLLLRPAERSRERHGARLRHRLPDRCHGVRRQRRTHREGMGPHQRCTAKANTSDTSTERKRSAERPGCTSPRSR